MPRSGRRARDNSALLDQVSDQVSVIRPRARLLQRRLNGTPPPALSRNENEHRETCLAVVPFESPGSRDAPSPIFEESRPQVMSGDSDDVIVHFSQDGSSDSLDIQGIMNPLSIDEEAGLNFNHPEVQRRNRRRKRGIKWFIRIFMCIVIVGLTWSTAHLIDTATLVDRHHEDLNFSAPFPHDEYIAPSSSTVRAPQLSSTTIKPFDVRPTRTTDRPNTTTAMVRYSTSMAPVPTSDFMCRPSTRSVVCMDSRLGICVLRQFGRSFRGMAQTSRIPDHMATLLMDRSDPTFAACRDGRFYIANDFMN